MFSPGKICEVNETQLRVAFDGDAVLFSDESERIYKAHGLDKFFEHEKAHENKPLDHVCAITLCALLKWFWDPNVNDLLFSHIQVTVSLSVRGL